MFDSALASAVTVRKAIHEKASENIQEAQKKQEKKLRLLAPNFH